jgi:hypothetical protein
MATVSAKDFFGGSIPPPEKGRVQPPSGFNPLGDIASAAKGGIDYGIQGYEKARTASNPLQLLEGSAQLGAGFIGALASPLAPILKPVGQVIDAATQPIQNNPAVQQFAMSPAGEATSRVAEDVSNLDAIAGFAAAPEAAVPGLKTLKNLATPKAVPVTPEITAAAAKAKSDAVATSLAKEWQAPAQVNKPAFNKPRAVLEKDPNTPVFLGKQGIDPRAHIEDGKYTTTDTADALRDTAGKMSTDTLRPSLQMADYVTPKTPVSELEQAAINQARKEPHVTAGDLESIISNIRKEAAALKTKYPDGMNLTEMHDNKITYAKNGGYSPIKSAADNNTATGNRAFGSALGQAVETKAPASVPVKDFNSYLGSYYKAADYLDTLNGKTAPTSLVQDFMRAGAKFGGAAVGSHFGGGIVSAFAGYSIGRAIEHALENMPNPMRGPFLRNLQMTNPEAFTKVQEYLHAQTSGNTGTPRLPAPRFVPLGSETKPAPVSSVRSVPAQKGLPNTNPKTGKIQSTYTSTPK